MRMTKLISTAVIFGTAMTAFALPASAGTTQGRTVKTTIQKSDLRTEADIIRTYAKLKETAAENCQTSGRPVFSNRNFERVCSTRLLDDFIQSVDHAALTQYHRSQNAG